MNKPILCIALDGLTKNEAETLTTAVALVQAATKNGFAEKICFKVNLDYLLRHGVKTAVERIAVFGRPVFADIKMWNGARTMQTVIEDLVAPNVAYLNIYALADTELAKTVRITEGTNTKVLGVTVLTHYDTDYCTRNFTHSLPEVVGHLARVAVDAGCHGIILPGTMLHTVKNLNTMKVIPGVRPQWYTDTRHKEAIEPCDAIRGGADMLVCGSPIMKAAQPIEAVSAVLMEMQ